MAKTKEISIETYLFFRQETQFLRIVFKNNFLFHYRLTKLLISAILPQEAVFHTYFEKKVWFCTQILVWLWETCFSWNLNFWFLLCREALPHLSDMVKVSLLMTCWNAIIMGYEWQHNLLSGWINEYYSCIYKNWKLIYVVFFLPFFDQLCFYNLGKAMSTKTSFSLLSSSSYADYYHQKLLV